MKQLRDYTYKIEGEHDYQGIPEGSAGHTPLNKPTLEIVGVNYRTRELLAIVEVELKEEGSKIPYIETKKLQLEKGVAEQISADQVRQFFAVNYPNAIEL